MALNPLFGQFGLMTWMQMQTLGATLNSTDAGTRCYCSDFQGAEFVWNGVGWATPTPGMMTYAQMIALPPPVADGTQVRVQEFHYAVFTYSAGRWVSTSPLSLFSSGIPFILPSSGTMSTNGAVTLNTALATTYPGTFTYFPAGAVYALSPAGWYYTVYSSATQGTVYGNMYPGPYNVTGDPDESVPISAGGKYGVAIPIVAAGPGAYVTPTSSAIQAVNYTTLMAGLIADFGAIDFTIIGNRPANANAHALLVVIGSTTIGQENGSGINALYMQRRIANLGGYKAQVFPPLTLQGPGTSSSVPSAYSAIDFTVAQNIAVTLNIGNVADYYVLDAFQAVAIFS